jgi:lipopolysaccharide export system protein LptA
MKKEIGYILITVLFVSCQSTSKKTGSSASNIQGTWELVSGTTIVKTDTTVTDYTKGQKMIKIINATHFAFLRHDLTKGKDSSAIFVAGGGRYTLTGDQYTEYLDYCNDRDWEGHTFQFKVSVNNDTLIQTGREKVEEAGVDRIIVEKYSKVK